MPSDQLFALVALAVVGSFTPGPNNTIATVTAANHGFRAAIPHMFGVPLGFASMLIAGSLGVAALLVAHPILPKIIKWAGIGYLLYIAYLIARAGRVSNRESNRDVAKPLTLWQSALFQYANPKAWMLAAATAATFMNHGSTALRTAIVCSVFALSAIASLVLWAAVGAGLRSWLQVGKRIVWFNLTMAALLAATAIWMLFDT